MGDDGQSRGTFGRGAWRPSLGSMLVLALLGIGGVASLATEVLTPDQTTGTPAAPGRIEAESLAEMRAALDRTAFRVAMLEAQTGKQNGDAAAPGQDVRSVAAAVALLNLRQQARTDQPFATDLALARPLLPDSEGKEAALEGLAAYAGGGVPSVDDLAVEYQRLLPLLQAQIRGAAAAGREGRELVRSLLAEVYLATPAPPDSRLELLQQVGTELQRGRLRAAVAVAGTLDPATRTIASGWLAAARVRLTLDESIDALLRTTLATMANGT